MQIFSDIKKLFFLIFAVFFLDLPGFAAEKDISSQPAAFNVQYPQLALSRIPYNITIIAIDDNGRRLDTYTGEPACSGIFVKENERIISLSQLPHFQNGELKLSGVLQTDSGIRTCKIFTNSVITVWEQRIIPGWCSLLPPIAAIALAIIFRQVLIALTVGVWVGTFCIYDYELLKSLLRMLDTILVSALGDPDHAAIVLFTMTLGGMVGIMYKSGGIQGIIVSASRYIRNPVSGQLATWVMGLVVFFDDYTNTLIVGNTMRPFTDKLRISREKLSYIVDSTAAPVCTIAVISSWVGYEVGLIGESFSTLGDSRSAYLTFLQSIPFSFYSILAIVYVFLIVVLKRDYAAMHRAEYRSRNTGKVLRDGANPLTDQQLYSNKDQQIVRTGWWNGLFPILAVIIITAGGLYYSGIENLGTTNASLHDIIAAANTFHVLMWASIGGTLCAVALTVSQRILNLRETMDAWVTGTKTMVMGIMIIILAWSIGSICDDLHTAEFVIHSTKNFISPHWLPLSTFLLASAISFATGTSWGTMAILIPLIIPLAFQNIQLAGISEELGNNILLGSIGGVLSGATFGDHCSPISDTTVMSSIGSACDHIDHVRTQLPYSLTVSLVAMLSGYIPAGYGVNPVFSLIFGVVLLTGLLLIIGKRI